jgi:hypothetical protein
MALSHRNDSSSYDGKRDRLYGKVDEVLIHMRQV